MSRLLGYARVSTDDQATVQQADALRRAGCEAIFEDEGVSGFFVQPTDRPGWSALMAALQPGDTIVVWRLDRVGRSLPKLIETIADLGTAGYGFKSLSESIDTTTAAGKAMFHMNAVFAQFYRDQISENTRLAMRAIKEGRRKQAPGKKAIGRPRRLSDEDTRAAGLLIAAGATRDEVARHFGTNRVTLWRALRQAGLDKTLAAGVNSANGVANRPAGVKTDSAIVDFVAAVRRDHLCDEHECGPACDE